MTPPPGTGTVRRVLDRQLRELSPGYFALVMAVGIVSRGAALDGATPLSEALLAVTAAAYVVLVAAYVTRFARYRRRFLADAANPVTAFAYFTFVAASDVLGTALVDTGRTAPAAVLFVVAGTAWLLLGYGVPSALIARHGPRPTLAGANGTWFLMVVGTQSVAVLSTSLPGSPALAALAVACWSVGVVLYVIVAGLVLSALLLFGARAADITPPYWVFMGATAISVLAGARLLSLPHDALLGAARPVLAGLSVVLWAFGTWLIPPLLALGVWRHGWRRIRLRYEPGWWSIVFPIGMYGVASHQLGKATGVGWLVTLGRYEFWAALAALLLVGAAMVGSVVGVLRRRDAAQ